MITFMVILAVVLAWLAGFNFGRRGKTNYVEIIPPGFIHRLHVEDPAHYDEQGRYLWWGD